MTIFITILITVPVTAIVTAFVIRANPKIILSANAISRAFHSIKKI